MSHDINSVSLEALANYWGRLVFVPLHLDDHYRRVTLPPATYHDDREPRLVLLCWRGGGWISRWEVGEGWRGDSDVKCGRFMRILSVADERSNNELLVGDLDREEKRSMASGVLRSWSLSCIWHSWVKLDRA